jgi:hypothetical protein
MKPIGYFFFASLVVCISLNCSSNKDHSELEFIPFEKMNYKIDTVKQGTAVDLIAYSGGKEQNEKDIYYSQFIGVNKVTNDTLRILTSLITCPGSISGQSNEARTVYLYSGQKRLTEAEIFPEDSTMILMQNLTGKAYSDNGSKDIPEDVSSLMKGIERKRFVVLNNGMDIFQRDLKTVIGVLHFKEQPWD